MIVTSILNSQYGNAKRLLYIQGCVCTSYFSTLRYVAELMVDELC